MHRVYTYKQTEFIVNLTQPCIYYVLIKINGILQKCNTELILFSFNKEEPTYETLHQRCGR